MIRISAAALGIAAILAAGSAYAQDDLVAAGEKVYKQCHACHSVGEGAKNRVGPEQNNLFGRVAGSLPDFRYSDAMKSAGENGLVWTEKSLHEYLKNPRAYVPKTKMIFAGLKKPEDIDAVVAYLKTFDTDGMPDPDASTYTPPNG
ncbi:MULTISPECIES: c-type cytochrome [Hyphomicrobiales]|uniref:Cytochrome c n=1 Tax=Rhodopseudomonas julia TaxID=200617 RepID=A0ABU0C2X5_9BRAD|nr:MULTISPECIES: cytochrome c family protein [Hyphomicrobiales]MDQ0324870.1 cytochrome c [Rhodopseudomonas julia]